MHTNNLPSVSFCRETMTLVKKMAGDFLDLGGRLSKICRGELWRDSGYGSFEDFLLEAEMSKSVASKLITVYEKLVVEYQIPTEKLISAKSYSKLYLVAKTAKDKRGAEEWVDKASVLYRGALEAEMRHDGQELDCSHEDCFMVKICRDCGRRIKVYENEV